MKIDYNRRPPHSDLEKEVARLFLEENLTRTQIVVQLTGRASKMTVLSYVVKAVRTARDQGIEVKPRAKASVDPDDSAKRKRRPLSPVHQAIGSKVLKHRMITCGMEQQEFCDAHKFANRKMIKEMEYGRHDFTLVELQMICSMLKVDLQSLMEVPKYNAQFAHRSVGTV